MMKTRHLRILVPVLLLSFGVAARADLSLDPTFGGSGIVGLNPSDGFDLGSGIAVQPADQKLVTVGVTQQLNGTDRYSHTLVARFLPDGTLDPSFGTNGTVTLLPGPTMQPGGGAEGVRVALQSDGKIVILGSFNLNDGSDQQLLFMRLDTNGALDPTFGTDGYLILDVPGAAGAFPEALALQTDGSILASGGVSDGPAYVLRLTSAGALDPSFDGDGVALITNPVDAEEAMSLNSLAILPGGEILAAGGGPDVVLVNLTAAGVLGTGLGGDGIATINVSSGFGVSSFDVAFSLAVLSDGKLLVSGVTVANLSVGNGNALLLRANADGSLDTTFGFEGLAPLADESTQDRALDLAVLSGGDIVVAGTGIKPTQVSAGGKFAVPLAGEFAPTVVSDLVLQADGAVAGAGRQTVTGADTELVALRLLGTPIVEPDLTPDPFSFDPQTNVETQKLIFSNPVTITGIEGPVPISISGGTGEAGGVGYGIGCGDISTYTSEPGLINPNETVCIALATPATSLTDVTATLKVGLVTGDFTVTTGSGTPEPFSFPTKTEVRLQTLVQSEPVRITGITVGVPICIESAETPGQCAGPLEEVVSQYSINCTGTFTAAAGRIQPDETVCVRHFASSLLNDTVTTTLLVGGVAGSFSSVTQTGGPLPGASAMDGWMLLLLPGVAAWRRRRSG